MSLFPDEHCYMPNTLLVLKMPLRLHLLVHVVKNEVAVNLGMRTLQAVKVAEEVRRLKTKSAIAG